MKMESVVKQRMSIMRKAVKMHEAEGYTKVLEAYDAMWGRITTGMDTDVEMAITSAAERLVDAFIADRLVVATNDVQKLQAKPTYQAFREWCQQQGMQMRDVPGMRSFGEAMRLRFEVKQSNFIYYLGVAFKEAEAA